MTVPRRTDRSLVNMLNVRVTRGGPNSLAGQSVM